MHLDRFKIFLLLGNLLSSLLSTRKYGLLVRSGQLVFPFPAYFSLFLLNNEQMGSMLKICYIWTQIQQFPPYA